MVVNSRTGGWTWIRSGSLLVWAALVADSVMVVRWAIDWLGTIVHDSCHHSPWCMIAAGDSSVY